MFAVSTDAMEILQEEAPHKGNALSEHGEQITATKLLVILVEGAEMIGIATNKSCSFLHRSLEKIRCVCYERVLNIFASGSKNPLFSCHYIICIHGSYNAK